MERGQIRPNPNPTPFCILHEPNPYRTQDRFVFSELFGAVLDLWVMPLISASYLMMHTKLRQRGANADVQSSWSWRFEGEEKVELVLSKAKRMRS